MKIHFGGQANDHCYIYTPEMYYNYITVMDYYSILNTTEFGWTFAGILVNFKSLRQAGHCTLSPEVSEY